MYVVSGSDVIIFIASAHRDVVALTSSMPKYAKSNDEKKTQHNFKGGTN